MVLAEGWTDAERLVVLYFLSHGCSRDGVLKLLRAKFGCDYSDYQIQQMLDDINIQGRILPYDSQRQEAEWDLDTVDVVIGDLRRQLPTGLADRLTSIQTPEEKTVLLNESEVDLTPIRDLAREQYRATHPPNPAGVSAAATEHVVSPRPAIPVILAPTNPTIPAPTSPFDPGQLGGPLIDTRDPTLLGTNFGGVRGAFYEQTLPLGRSQTAYPGQNLPPDGPGIGGSQKVVETPVEATGVVVEKALPVIRAVVGAAVTERTRVAKVVNNE